MAPVSTGSCARARFLALGVATLVAASGCGGGGGASGSSRGFVLTDVQYGRQIDDGSGARLVSPLTTVAVDPVTGFVLPGSLQPLASGVDVQVLQGIGLGLDYLPVVIPRNGVLRLEFSAPIDPASVVADGIDSQGSVTEPGSIQLRTDRDRGVAVSLSQPSPNVLWLSPVTATTIAFPASPVDFAPDGSPRASSSGFLHLQFPKTGAHVLRGAAGGGLVARGNGLGTVATPIGLNPGNRILDFIAQGRLIPTGDTFNGCLPDFRSPRIVRVYAWSIALDFAGGDGTTATQLHLATASFSDRAHYDLGEWATATLTLRPGLPGQETHAVVSNGAQDVTIADAFVAEPRDGDVIRLERAERFEPDPAHPIDPDTYDLLDPENANNAQFSRFVEAWEIDADGVAVAGPLDPARRLPPFCELRVRFDEPIDPDSVGAYEDFQVRYDPDRGPGSEFLSQSRLDAAQTTVVLRPALVDPASGTFRIVGWGRGVKELRFGVRAVPRISYLQQRMDAGALADWIEQGERGITDLGGQPLAFPDSLFDPDHPSLDFSVPFVTDESASSQQPPPVVASYGVVVHRMQGRPRTGIDPATGLPGVKYVDQPGYYAPIADVNLQANGYLAGAPVVFVSKIHDDVFPPPVGQFGAFALGASTPLSSYTTASGPQPHDGARFQTVYRDVDASPNRDALAGTLLDLYRFNWAPIGGHVTTDLYEDISIHCAHSSFRPSTNTSNFYGYVGAAFLFSGLAQTFDFDSWTSLIDPNAPDRCPIDCSWTEGPNYWDTLVTTVPPGTTYKVTESSLFTPPFDTHAYEPWPTFATPFQYNNGAIPQAERDLRAKINADFDCHGQTPWLERRVYASDPAWDNSGGDSLLIEVRIRPQRSNVSRTNGFTFAPGILTSYWPMFRVYSVGSPGLPVRPDNPNILAGRCAIGNTTWPNNAAPYCGDNSRYFAEFDYVKTTSIITSPFVRIFPSTSSGPHWFAPTVLPDPAAAPGGTQIRVEFGGADNVGGGGATAFSDDLQAADGKDCVVFRATLAGNPDSLLLPNFDLIAIPYLRSDGD